MGLKASVTGTVSVVAATGFRLTLAPLAVAVPFGSVSMVAKFTVTIQRDAGHAKTVYLGLIGMAGNWTFSRDNFVSGADVPVILEVNVGGFQVGQSAEFQVDGYDDINDRPPAEVRE